MLKSYQIWWICYKKLSTMYISLLSISFYRIFGRLQTLVLFVDHQHWYVDPSFEPFNCEQDRLTAKVPQPKYVGKKNLNCWSHETMLWSGTKNCISPVSNLAGISQPSWPQTIYVCVSFEMKIKNWILASHYFEKEIFEAITSYSQSTPWHNGK